ncbi:MAG: hypothetical protein AAB037_04045 [Chloroflexota bacterium]
MAKGSGVVAVQVTIEGYCTACRTEGEEGGWHETLPFSPYPRCLQTGSSRATIMDDPYLVDFYLR